jgi:hypothetical protein
LAAAKERHQKNVEQARSFAVEFPQRAMRGSLAELAKVLLDGSEVPVEFGFMSAITTFGLIAAETLKLKQDALKVNSNLYTVLVAPTGGKKSTAVWKVVDFFKCHGLTDDVKDDQKALVFAKAGSGEGLLKLFRPSFKENSQWVTKSRTRVLLVPDEFQGVLHKCRVENSTLAPELTTFFDGTSAGNATKDKAVNVKDGHLAMVGCITTTLWDETWSQGMERSLGLLNRLFLVSSLPKPKVFQPPVPDADKLAKLHCRIKNQLAHASEIDMSAEARQIFDEFYLEVDETQEESTRIETIVKKVALILAVFCTGFFGH